MAALSYPRDLWGEAARSMGLGDEDRSKYLGAKTSGGIADALLGLAQQRESASRGREWRFKFRDRSISIRAVLENIMKWRAKFEKAVDFAVSYDASGHAALPWAGVKFILDIVCADLDKYAGMAVGMEFVAREIHFYTIFETVYLKEQSPAADQLAMSLVKTYELLLGHLVSSAKYFDTSLLKRIGKAPFEDDAVGSMMDSIQKSRVIIQRNADLIEKQDIDRGLASLSLGQQQLKDELSAWKEPLESISVQLAEVDGTTKRNLAIAEDTLATMEEMKAAIGKLSSVIIESGQAADALSTIRTQFQLPSPREIQREYEQRKKELVQGTGAWVIEQPAFVGWSRTTEHRVLTICGKPGSGKSYLSTVVLNHLFAMDDSHLLIGHYFFRDTDERKRSACNALGAIVYQLARQNDMFAQRAAQACRQSAGYSQNDIRTIWDDFLGDRFEPGSDLRLCLVLDGLDEAVTTDIEVLVRLFRDALDSGAQIQILMVGRPEIAQLTSPLKPFSASTIHVSSALNSHDMVRFIKNRYSQHLSRFTSPKVRKAIIKSLLEKADGMFLWVDLVCLELARLKTQHQIHEHMKTMPNGLKAMYDRIFSRMQSTQPSVIEVEQLRALFCFLAQLKQPPTVLFLNQMIRTLSMKPDFDVEAMIEGACESLITYEERGEALVRKLSREPDNQDPRQTDTGADVDGESDSASLSELDEASESEEDEDEDGDEDGDGDGDGDEDGDESDTLVEECQRDTLVKLCHASLGDYLRREDLETSSILFGPRDGAFNALLYTLRVACAGSSAPEEAWLYAVSVMWFQLRYLDDMEVSPVEAVRVVERLHEFFCSESLARHIARVSNDSRGLCTLSNTFSGTFLGSSSPSNEAWVHRTIRVWMERVSQAASQLKTETKTWMEAWLQAPATLLVPMTKACARELFAAGEENPLQLHRRYCFLMECYRMTNLPAQSQTPTEPPEGMDDHIRLESLATLAGIEMSIDLYCLMARATRGARAKRVYEKALMLCRQFGDAGKLKDIHWEAILAMSRVSSMECDIEVVPFIEQYLVQDQTSYQVQACWGVAQLASLKDFDGAIDTLRRALAMRPEDNLVAKVLLSALNSHGKHHEMLKLLLEPDDDIAGYRIRAILCGKDLIYRQEWKTEILAAAVRAKQLEAVAGLFEREMKRRWKPHPLEEDMSVNRLGLWNISLAVAPFNTRRFYKASNRLLQCWLAFLHKRYLGQSAAAIRHWSGAFLEDLDIYHILDSDDFDSADTTGMVFDYIGEFAETLYIAAQEESHGDGSVDKQLLKPLEELALRFDVFRQARLDVSSKMSGESTTLCLARMYLRAGKTTQATDMFQKQVRRLTRPYLDDPYFEGTGVALFLRLAQNLFARGLRSQAATALCLSRFSLCRDTAGPNSDGVWRRSQYDMFATRGTGCSRSFNCLNADKVTSNCDLYTCMTCADIHLCEACYAEHTDGGATTPPYLCHPSHEHLKTPMATWSIKSGVGDCAYEGDNIMTVDGREVQLRQWLSDLC